MQDGKVGDFWVWMEVEVLGGGAAVVEGGVGGERLTMSDSQCQCEF